MQQQLERERVALLPQRKARLRLRPDVPRADVGGSSTRQCGRCHGVPPWAHRRVIRWGDGVGCGGVDRGRKGGRRCRRRRCRDARLSHLVGFERLCVRRVYVSVVVEGLVLCQDGRQVLQKGCDVFRNGRVRRRGLLRLLLMRHRPVVVMDSRGPARPWLGELLEKVVQPRELCGFFVGRRAGRSDGGVGGRGVHGG